MLQRMRSIGPTILTLLAVVCLWAPPAAVVHAHDDGHAPHCHGSASQGGIHLPLRARHGADGRHAHRHAHPHAHPHPHDHAHPHGGPSEAAGDGSGEAPSEPHVHLDDGIDAVSRLRGSTGAGAPADPSATYALVLAWGSPSPLAPTDAHRASRTQRARPPDPARALDVLIALGRLQV